MIRRLTGCLPFAPIDLPARQRAEPPAKGMPSDTPVVYDDQHLIIFD
jgi:hypothetical protein